MMKVRHHNFTLIEILAVLMILGVVFSLMLPSFNRMINGNKVDQMTSRLKLGLEQAHSQAVTSRRNVALILPNESDKWKELGAEYCLGAYRLAYVTFEKDAVNGKDDGSESGKTDGTCEFVSWVDDSEWTNRPDGAYLVRILGKGDTDFDQTEWMKNGTGVKNASTKPANAVQGAANLLKVEKVPDADGKTSDRDTCAIVFSPYGEVRNKELKLVVAEAALNGDTLVFPSRTSSGNPLNYLVLGINKFTGRTAFLPLQKAE